MFVLRLQFRAWLSRSYSTAPSPNLSASGRLHKPVMLQEVVENLQLKPGCKILDMTFGAGGHTSEILAAYPDIVVYALDRDPVAYGLAQKCAESYGNRLVPMLGKFSELEPLLAAHDISDNYFDGVLLDAGCSSMQFDNGERGFAISHNGPLDMRMDGSRFPDQPTAADVLAHIEEDALVKILKTYGEEKQAKKIARGIVESRYLLKKLHTTAQLAALVSEILGSDMRMDKLQRPNHVATKTFQALRIFVNDELNELNHGIVCAHRLLKTDGRMVTLSFHSLEDRIIKRHFTGIDLEEKVSSSISQKYKNSTSWYSKETMDALFDRKWQMLNKHVLVPSDEEVSSNPRSRSAKLRVVRWC